MTSNYKYFPNIVLKSAFQRNVRNSLNICHLNAQSLPSSIDELQIIFENVNLHIIAISETWLKPYIPTKNVKINNFILLRHDRAVRRGGGVAIYINKNINFKIIKKSDIIYKTEYLFIEIILPLSKILFGVFYKAPTINEFDVIEEIIIDLTPRYNEVILCGDFNENLLLNNARSSNFRHIFDQMSLEIINTEATHFQGIPTLLDLFITNNSHLVKISSQVSIPGISKHDLLFISYYCDINDLKDKSYSKRFLSTIDQVQLNIDAQNMDWNLVFDCNDVDFMTKHLTTSLLILLDQHAPLTLVQNKISKRTLWFTPVVKIALVERDIAYIQHKRLKTNDSLIYFKILRNKASAAIKRAKLDYIANKIDFELPSREVWRNLKRFNVVSTKKHQIVPSFTADEFNSYITTSNNNATIIDNNKFSSTPVGHFFSFKHFTVEEVLIAFSHIKSNSIGLDSLPRDFLFMLLPSILPIITYIFNIAITTSTFPNSWKKAKVLPIPKKKQFN